MTSENKRTLIKAVLFTVAITLALTQPVKANWLTDRIGDLFGKHLAHPGPPPTAKK